MKIYQPQTILLLSLLAIGQVYGAIANLEVTKPVVDCSALLKADLTTVVKGANITAATTTTNNGITYCSVQGTVPPAMGWQVMLPTTTWAQRYMQIGCGGLCGNIGLGQAPGAADGSASVDNGSFVLAATDMDGGNDGKFGLVREKRIEFAHLAQHQTALIAKNLIKTYYGKKAAYSYFNGCSDGGREAVMEAIRYPDDFNGIIAGAPAMLFQFQNSFHHGYLAVSNTNKKDNTHIVLADRLSIIHNAVIKACDTLDGIQDNLLSDPRLCNFNPKSIQCRPGTTDNSTCLTSAEVQAITKFYTGPIDPKTGQHLTVGEEQYGSELAWNGVFVGRTATDSIMSTSTAESAIPNLIFDKYPGDNFTVWDFKFEKATIDLLRPRHPLFDAVSPDLSKFHKAGHKLILWHGWADPHISPRTTIAFHEALQATMGNHVVDEFERLYLLPGVYHCGQGEGPSYLDLVTPIMEWVESGVAPFAVETSTQSKEASSGPSDFGQWSKRRLANSTSAVNRPVYPYPWIAQYTGAGSVNVSTNFKPGQPLYTQKTRSWLGEDFFHPYTPIQG